MDNKCFLEDLASSKIDVFPSRDLSLNRLKELSVSSLAWLGDSIYEDFFRKKLFFKKYKEKNLVLHSVAKSYVSAKAQALVYDVWKDMMLEEDLPFYKRAKNFKTKSHAKNTDIVTYHKATAVEAFCAYLFLCGREKELLCYLNRAYEFLEDFNRKDF